MLKNLGFTINISGYELPLYKSFIMDYNGGM